MNTNNPQSRLWLCKTDLENDYKNTLTFSSLDAQRNYFIGNPLDPTDFGVSTKSYTEFTYLRLEQFIKVNDFIEDIDTNNYLVLINDSKYYYYFITSMEYIDDSTTRINIELDVMQTYFFDIEYKNTFVEREHVTDDTVGKHTIPEGLETGEYIIGTSGVLDLNPAVFEEQSIVMAVTLDPDFFPDIDTIYYGGCYSGTVYLEFSGVNLGQAGIFIKALNHLGKLDAITSIFMLPTFTLDVTGYQFSLGSVTVTCNLVDSTQDAFEYSISIGAKPTTLGTYTPRNKKLLTSDYNFLLLDNGSGGVKKYNYEDFDTTGTQGVLFFDHISSPSPSGSVMYAPRYYKNNTQNLVESFAGAKFPMCSWSSDPYTNWLTQTGINRAFGYGKDLGQILLGTGALALGGVNPAVATFGATQLGMGIGSALNDITNNVQQKKEHQIAPNELSGNESLGDVAFAHYRCIPKFYQMHIKEEYAKICDKYFDMFGYKVNMLKTPNIHTRKYWNYIKTNSCNFTGNIPQTYMDKIKSIFDTGITFWHDPSKMFDYSQTNSILS